MTRMARRTRARHSPNVSGAVMTVRAVPRVAIFLHPLCARRHASHRIPRPVDCMKAIGLLLALAACATLTLPSHLRAQQALAPLAVGDSAPTFAEMQRAFLQWSTTHDLSTERGWKWYKRWEASEERRAMPGGRPADGRTYWLAAGAALDARRTLAGVVAEPGWRPVGPDTLAYSGDEYWVTGLGRINCIAFHPTDSNTFWVGVAQGGVWKTVDGGASWRPLTDELPILRVSDIAVDPNDPDNLYIAVGDFEYLGVSLASSDRKRHTHYGLGVYRTTDGGATWSPSGLSFRLKDYDGSLIRRILVQPTDSRRLLAVGTGGTWTSSDAGETWTHGRTDLIFDARRDPSRPDVVVASTGYLALFGFGDASIIRSTDFGATWTTSSSPIPPRAAQRIDLAFAPSNPLYVYAVACNTSGGLQGVYRSTDGGVTWSARATRSSAPNILGWSNGEQDAGNGQGTYDLAIVVDPTNPERVFVGGINVWGSEDGGAHWNGVTYWVGMYGASIHGDQHAFATSPLTGVYFVCNDGGVHTTRDLAIGSWDSARSNSRYEWPTMWRNLTAGMAITSFYRIGLSRDNPGYVVGGAQDNATFYFDRSRWRHLFGGDGMDCFIDPVDPHIVFGSAQFGYLATTPDAGETEVDAGTQKIDDAGEWTTPFVQDPGDRGTIYGGYGDLWRIEQGDTAWRKVSSFEPIAALGYPAPMTALAVSSADSRYIYLAKKILFSLERPSEVWMSSDRGASWRNVTAGLPDSLYITSIAAHASDPRAAWVTCGGFVDGVKVFRTTDAGATWMNVSRDLPDLPVNAIVHDPQSPNNTVYVGTDIGVYYTNDALAGWRPFSLNLPNVIVSDLEIHASTRTIYAATFGRGVWMSELPEPSSVDGSVAPRALTARVEQDGGRGAIVVEVESPTPIASADVEVVDVLGRRIASRALAIGGTHARVVLDLGIVEGVYFARVSARGRSQVVRFVVRH
jgi:photosystem II stability/assembly factor-like uncharacterized protein